MSIRRRQTRSSPRSRGRASATQGRRHRYGRGSSNPPRQTSHGHDSHSHDTGRRSYWSRFCHEPRATGRKYYWIVHACAGEGKRLEILKEIVSGLSRVAVFGTSTEPSNARELKEIELAAGALGIKLQYRDVLSLDDIEIAFQAAVKERAGAVYERVRPHQQSSPKRDCRARR